MIPAFLFASNAEGQGNSSKGEVCFCIYVWNVPDNQRNFPLTKLLVNNTVDYSLWANFARVKQPSQATIASNCNK
jgi:hypothetical protein